MYRSLVTNNNYLDVSTQPIPRIKTSFISNNENIFLYEFCIEDNNLKWLYNRITLTKPAADPYAQIILSSSRQVQFNFRSSMYCILYVGADYIIHILAFDMSKVALYSS